MFYLEKLKQKRCQAVVGNVSALGGLSFFCLFVSLAASCGKKWDPNLQFENELNLIEEQNAQRVWREKNEAKLNLSALDQKIRTQICVGLPNYDVSRLLGDSFITVAKETVGETDWLVIRYKWQDIVSLNFSTNSEEYKICSKNNDYLEITLNDQGIISFTWL